ncbi:MAG TPA: glycosyltransferase [Holophagaceae bacterium]|nr:glycosyltransferase [Holophagaceae bacterium]
MSGRPRVSAIVVSFNREEDLRLSLEALSATGYPDLEIIVVDNASKDGAAEVAAAHPGVRLLRNERNLGFAEANNQGLELATGDYIALINNDAVVEPSYFDDLVAFMETHPRAAAAGGKAYFWDEDHPVGRKENRYYSYTLVDPDTGWNQGHADTPDEVREVATLSGCAVMVRRAAIEDVGAPFLEPLFFTYYEETDFFARAIRRGWKLYYTGTPAVWHRVRASTAAFPYHYHFHMERNRLLYAWRNFEAAELESLERALRREIRRKLVFNFPKWMFSRKVERRAKRDAWRWYLRHRPLLAEHRALAAGGDIPYNRAVRTLQAGGEDYYGHDRPEVAGLVPDTARFIVDIGCGAGRLGASVKARLPQAQVRGLELVPEQAERARALLDEVQAGVAENLMPAHWPTPDCLIFADVLEHLADPWTTLKAWVERLDSGGTVVLSLPNVGHHSVVSGLLKGRWEYQDAGILDRTHLRFFTRASALELARQAGLEVERTGRVIEAPMKGSLHRKLHRWAGRRAAAEPISGQRGRLRRLALDLCTVQFLIVARKA